MTQEELNKELNIIYQDIGYDLNHKKILFSVPESAGDIFLATSLLESLKETYPDFNIYFACKLEFKDILKNNPYIYKVIQYRPIMDHFLYMEGYSDYKGLFDIAYVVTLFTQKFASYTHNGIDKISFNLKK